ncbi:MAG TPA: hypothetical protein VKU82_01035 [Planctomycetaceae bacterium]|nr:hypothetical protein [Planctomycetaceae bacterium]
MLEVNVVHIDRRMLRMMAILIALLTVPAASQVIAAGWPAQP